MPTSYDGTLLDHLAKHIMYLSSASSFWFSLNSSYNHDGWQRRQQLDCGAAATAAWWRLEAAAWLRWRRQRGGGGGSRR